MPLFERCITSICAHFMEWHIFFFFPKKIHFHLSIYRTKETHINCWFETLAYIYIYLIIDFISLVLQNIRTSFMFDQMANSFHYFFSFFQPLKRFLLNKWRKEIMKRKKKIEMKLVKIRLYSMQKCVFNSTEPQSEKCNADIHVS